MPYTVKLKRSAERELDNLPTKIHDKVINILLSLRENPFPRNSKKLRGRESYRIRLEIIEYSTLSMNLIKT